MFKPEDQIQDSVSTYLSPKDLASKIEKEIDLENDSSINLDEIFTSHLFVKKIEKIKYHQYVTSSKSSGDDQWCFQAELFLRQKYPQCIVSLFSKELWCFSLNDDPLPVPYPVDEETHDDHDFKKTDDIHEELNDYTQNSDFSIEKPKEDIGDFLQQRDIQKIENGNKKNTKADDSTKQFDLDFSFLKPRKPDKVGYFTPQFSKPNLPTPYAIFLKAIRRVIYLNLSMDSKNDYIPFGNSCIYTKENKLINFHPHLFENGDLNLSLSIKDLNILKLSDFYFGKHKYENAVLYMAPSSVKACLLSPSNLEENISSEPPVNAHNILQTLLASHGIDLFYKEHEIKWVKIYPSLAHLSGQTPPISSFNVSKVDHPNYIKRCISWPMDLLFVQPPLNMNELKTGKLQDIDIFSFDDAFDLINDFVQLKVTSSYKTNGAGNNKNSNGALSSGSSYYTDSVFYLGSVQTQKNSLSPNISNNGNSANTSANSTPMHKSSPLLSYTAKGSPDDIFATSPFSETGGQNKHHVPNMLTSLQENDAFEQNNISINNDLDDFVKTTTDRQDPLKDEAIMEVSNFDDNISGTNNDDEDDDEDDDDDMKDLFGDDDDNEDEENLVEQESSENISDTKVLNPLKETEEVLSKDDTISSSVNDFTLSKPASLLPAKRYIDIPFDEITKSDFYNDPGAPLPVVTPKERRQSVYSALNFNPIIESSVDNKYRNGGKFFVPSLETASLENMRKQCVKEKNKSPIPSTNFTSPSTRKMLLSNTVYHGDDQPMLLTESNGGSNYDEIALSMHDDQDMGYQCESESSSDEDENGMVTIQHITSINPTQPVSSIHGAANQFGRNVLQGSNSSVKNNFVSTTQAQMAHPLPLHVNSIPQDADNNYKALNTLVMANQYIPVTIPSSTMLTDPPHGLGSEYENEIKEHNNNSRLLNNINLGVELSNTNSNNENLMLQNPIMTENLKSPNMVENMFWKQDGIPTSNSALGNDELLLQRSPLFITESGASLKSNKSSPAKFNVHQTIIGQQNNKLKNLPKQDGVESEEENLAFNSMNITENTPQNLQTDAFVKTSSLTSAPVFDVGSSNMENQTVNVLPFVLRHMPLFSIPSCYLKENPHVPNSKSMQDFLNCLTSELIFNTQLGDFGIPDSHYEVFKKLNSNSKIYETLHSLFNECSRMTGTDLIDEFEKFKEPQVYVKRNAEDGKESTIKINSESFQFMDSLRFKPFKKSKSFSGLFLTSRKRDDCLDFMNNLVLQYNDFHLGSCDLVQLTSEDEPGLIYLKNMDSHTLLLLAAQIVTYCFTQQRHFKDQNRPLVIFLPVDESRHINSVIDMCHQFSIIRNEVLSKLPTCELFLRLIPVANFITNPLTTVREYNRLCISIYNILPRVTSKYTQLAHNPPEKVELKLQSSKNTSLSSPGNYLYDAYIHVAYSRTIDKEWICASWSTTDGSEFYVKTWYIGNSKTKFESCCNEIWATSLKFIALSNAVHNNNNNNNNNNNTNLTSSGLSSLVASGALRTCIVLARLDSILPDDELMHWRRLSSKTKQIHLAVICCGSNTKFTMFDANKHTSDISFLSKKFDFTDKEEQKKLFDEDYVLSKPKNDTYMAIFKYALPLSNSQHRCSIKSGALIKLKSKNSCVSGGLGDGDGIGRSQHCGDSTDDYDSVVDKFEVNLLNCPHADSKRLLRTILKQYHDMSFLNAWFSMSNDDDKDNFIPYHILAVAKVLKNIVHIRVEDE